MTSKLKTKVKKLFNMQHRIKVENKNEDDSHA